MRKEYHRDNPWDYVEIPQWQQYLKRFPPENYSRIVVKQIELQD